MEKNIGIMTIQDNNNYGNRLQNYAVMKLLFSMGKCKNIVFKFEENKIKYYLKTLIPYRLKKGIKSVLKREFDVLESDRHNSFQRFSNKLKQKCLFLKERTKLYEYQFDKEYDCVVVGSDQVWNPDFAGVDFFFLDFVDPSKRIAFAASIGYTELDDEVLERYTTFWQQMRYISVRENSAADIIEKAIGKRPDVFLDPTLLLTKEEWDEIAKRPECNLPDKYVLCLFLGNMPEVIIENYKKVYGLELIVLNDKTYPKYYIQGPAEFVWLIKNAELILTDSFHCSVFSIIYHKQFSVYDRDDDSFKNMFTRMETLLTKFDMMDRVKKTEDKFSVECISEQRFVEADKIRQKERERVLSIIGELINEDK